MLSPQEDKALRFLATYTASHNGLAPTLVEIGEGIGLHSKGVVHRYVQKLIRKGLVECAGGWRGLKLTPKGKRYLATLPLPGRIVAGLPLESIAGQDEINLVEALAGPGRYVLKVSGDSMVEAGIFDGDYVVIRHAETARNGDLVVALIDGTETTLKRFRRKGRQIELIPENRALKPMLYPPERVQIQGVVVGQFRLYAGPKS